LKSHYPEYALLISLAVGIFVFTAILSNISPVISKVSSLFSQANIPSDYMKVLLKSLGICILVQFCCDTCRDAGQTALASKLELAGKVAVLGVSLPLFEKIINITMNLLHN
jgi:stage III sporulation protein AD